MQKKWQIQHSLSGINVYVCNNKIIPQRAKKILGNVWLSTDSFFTITQICFGFFLEYSQKNTIEHFQSRKSRNTEKTATISV